MRRIAFTIASLAALGALLVATAGADDKRTYQAELFNAFGLVEGAELRVAGVQAGTITDLDITPQKTALVTFEVGSEFPELKADASCSAEPQSLIAEYFLNCQPGSSDQPLEAPIEAARNRTTVQSDLVQNTLREPFKRRLQLVINEFGTALVGNSENLNAAIRAGAPALREFKQVLNILGRQNTIIAQLNSDADAVFARLAERREDVVRFIDEAEDTARISAERRQDLTRDFDLLDDFLFELRPVMTELGNLAREGTPLLSDLRASAPGLNKLARNLPRFSNGARVSLKAVGGASDVGRRALVKGRDEINELDRASLKAQPAADIVAEFLESIDDPRNAVEETCLARRDLRELPGEADRRLGLLEAKVGDLSGDRSCDPSAPAGSGNPGYTGLEALLNYAYNQTLSLNLFDYTGHGLYFTLVGAPAVPLSGECASTNNEQDWAARGGGETTDPREAAECVSILGDTQPGITVGKDPSRSPSELSLTGDLSRYPSNVCPDGSADHYLCNPGDPPKAASAQLRGATAPTAAETAPTPTTPSEQQQQQQQPPPERVDQALDRIKQGTATTKREVRKILGLLPGAPLPPQIGAALGLSPQAPESSTAAQGLLDFLLGP